MKHVGSLKIKGKNLGYTGNLDGLHINVVEPMLILDPICQLAIHACPVLSMYVRVRFTVQNQSLIDKEFA